MHFICISADHLYFELKLGNSFIFSNIFTKTWTTTIFYSWYQMLFLVWSLFLWPNMFTMHMTKKWFSLIWPQHTIIAVLLLTLAEVQGLHFVRCPQEGLLSSNTTKAFVVMNLTLETYVFSLRTKCKCSTASSRGHIPAIISIVCSGKETSYAVFWDTGFFILIQVVRNEDKRNEDKIIYYNKWPLYFPHK